MGNIAMPIAESLKFSDFVVRIATADLTDEIARRRARGTEGASIAWALGHLLHYRHLMMELLGETGPNPWAEQFATTAATDGADYTPLAELLHSWQDTSSKALPMVAGATDDALLASMGGPDAPHGEKRVLDTFVFFMWHESYHIGQLGTLRTQFGLTPTSTLATAQQG